MYYVKTTVYINHTPTFMLFGIYTKRRTFSLIFTTSHGVKQREIISQCFVVVVYPLLLACWGESVSVGLWGSTASFSSQSSSRAATPEGSLRTPRTDSVVCICGQLRRCGVRCS